MWFAPYLRVRRALAVYSLIVVAFAVLGAAMRFMPNVNAAQSAGQAASASRISFDLWYIVVSSAAVVAGFATVLGLNLAAENDGHLEYAWTRPASRERYALGVFGVDVVAIALAQLVTVLGAVLVADVWIGHQALTVHAQFAWLYLAAIALPINIYAWITMLTASLKRNRGAVAGVFWPALVGVQALTFIPVPIVHAIGSAVNTVNPLAIFSTNTSHPAVPLNYALGTLLSLALLALAMLQWRRLEA